MENRNINIYWMQKKWNDIYESDILLYFTFIISFVLQTTLWVKRRYQKKKKVIREVN